MESYVNDLLDNGWDLPIPRNYTRYILKETVKPYDGFLLIDFDIDFTQDFTFDDLSLREKTIVQK